MGEILRRIREHPRAERGALRKVSEIGRESRLLAATVDGVALGACHRAKQRCATHGLFVRRASRWGELMALPDREVVGRLRDHQEPHPRMLGAAKLGARTV